MQSTTRWCLNEGSMSSCKYDRIAGCSRSAESIYRSLLSECSQAERVGFDYLCFPQVMLKLTDSDNTQCSCGFASTLFHRLQSIQFHPVGTEFREK